MKIKDLKSLRWREKPTFTCSLVGKSIQKESFPFSVHLPGESTSSENVNNSLETKRDERDIRSVGSAVAQE
jgi:hypothetical protein